MKTQNDASEPELVLDIFCTPQGDAWRLYLRPGALPPGFRQYFDAHCEAYPVYLDLEELDRYMTKRNAPFEKHLSRACDIELTARGESAIELAKYLSSAFASGFRSPEDGAGALPESARRGA